MRLLLLKIFLRSVSILILLMLCVLGVTYYLLNSSRGAALVLSFARDTLQQDFQITYDYDDLDGSLMQGLSFSRLQVTHPQFSLESDDFESAWSLLSLLNKQLAVEGLQIDNLSLQIEPAAQGVDNEAGEDLVQTLQSIFQIPISISLQDIALNNPRLQQGEQNLEATGIALTLDLDAQRLRLDDVAISAYDAVVTGSLALQAENLLIDGNLDWELNGVTLPVDTDSDALVGTLFFSGNLNEIEISHNLLQPFTINSEGTLLTGLLSNSAYNFSFEHALDMSALLPEQNFISSLSGDLLTHGSPDLIFIDTNLTLDVRDLSPMTLLIAGEYSDSRFSVETINLSSDEIALLALAEISPQPFNLSMDWSLTRLELDNYLQNITLQNTQAGGSLNLGEGGNSTINLSFLTATLNGYPMDASGLLELDDNQLNRVDLDIRTGANQLNLAGSADTELDINWRLNAPDLSIILPTLEGEVFGSGRIEGAMPNPLIQGNLEGNELQYSNQSGEYRLASLDASFNTSAGNYQAELLLNNLRAELDANDYQLDQLQLTFNGTAESHQSQLGLRSPQVNFATDLQGAYQNEAWQGRFNRASFAGDYGDWQLANPINATVGSGTVTLSQHCWRYLQTDLCLQGNLRDENFNLTLAINELPLPYLNTDDMITRIDDPSLNQEYEGKPVALDQLQQNFNIFLPLDTFTRGRINTQVQVQGNTQSLASTNFNITLDPGEVELSIFRVLSDERQSVQPEIRSFFINHRDLQLSRQAGNMEGRGHLSLIHQETDELLNVQSDIDVALGRAADDRLSGNVDLNISNLDWLEALLPNLRNTRGSMNGTVELAGDYANPVLLADLNIEDASFELPEYGINPQQINLNFSSNDRDTMRIRATAVSGGGSLNIDGTATSIFDPQRSFTVNLQGENFDLINSATTRMNVSPELSISLRNNALDLQGSVLVPTLVIDLRDNEALLQNNSVDVTRDAVIINAPSEQAHLIRNQQQQNIQDIPITAELALVLGENVHFQGLNLDIFLDGQLQVQQERDRPLLTNGDISIREGSYEIYAQRLDVSNGKLIFFGNPTNPALDIRAYRTAGEIQAGLQINGTLRNMNSRLFSTPSLPENEILAILITGKSLQDINNQEQTNLVGAVASLGINRGQGFANAIGSELGLDSVQINSQVNLEQSTLGLGKYLTPDLFMQYEIGLFEKESVLSLDYILNDRLRLEVQSGISQSIDMTYTVEK